MPFLVLKDKTVCPACHRRTWPVHFNGCKSCGVMLFLRPINYESWARDGNSLEYYVFDPMDGWVHSTQVKERRAVERDYVPVKLPENYGRAATPQSVIRDGKLASQGRLKVSRKFI